MGIIACDADGKPWTQALDEPTYQLLLAIHQRTPLGLIHPEALAALPALLPLEILAGFTLSTDDDGEL